MPDVDSQLRSAAFGHGHVTDRLLAAATRPRQRWLAAVVLGARGQYARAHTLLEPVSRHADGGVASLAYSTLASHRRQLGGHAEARRLDAAALRQLPLTTVRCGGGSASDGGWVCDVLASDRGCAHRGSTSEDDDEVSTSDDGTDIAGAFGDALIGLAADAVGCQRLGEADRLLARADGTTVDGRAVLSSWRTTVRWYWVRAEVALRRGDSHGALSAAAAAAHTARRAGAARHAAKSDLLRAAGNVVIGATDTAAAALARAMSAIDTRGWDSLAWPAAGMAAQLDATRSGDDAAILHGVLRRTDPAGRIVAGRSAWTPSTG